MNASSNVTSLTKETVSAIVPPQEEAGLSRDPLEGYTPEHIAIHLFNGRHLDAFTKYLEEQNLTPNIVLENGLTLLQHSLLRFPKDVERLACLLSNGADPNLYGSSIDEQTGFGTSAHLPSRHPLNYAFAHCPETTSPAICRLLRSYGASVEGIRVFLERAPTDGVVDDLNKAQLRRELIALNPSSEFVAQIRQDVVFFKNPVAAEPKRQAPYQEGAFVEGKGIYFGLVEPVDRGGKLLGQTFYGFAAQHDLKDEAGNRIRKIYKTVVCEIVPALKGLHGHNGARFDDAQTLFEAFQGGHYKGEWFVPPLYMLRGVFLDSCGKENKNLAGPGLYALRHQVDFSGTFLTEAAGGICAPCGPGEGLLAGCCNDDGVSWAPPSCYASNSPGHVASMNTGVAASFAEDGRVYLFLKNHHELAYRPCRLEPAG